MFLLIFAIAFIATVLSTLSGAGVSLVTLPVLLLLGFPLPVAMAANTVSGALWTPFASLNYLGKAKVDLRLCFLLIVPGLLGAYLGTEIILNTDAMILQRIFGILILVIVFFVFMQKNFGIEESPEKMNRFFTGLLAAPLGFYETFFGAGNGIFTSVMLIKTRGIPLNIALGYYYLVSCTWCIFGSYLYFKAGHFDYALLVPSTIGGILGAYVGSLIGSRKGSKFVRLVFLSLGSVLGLKLALGF